MPKAVLIIPCFNEEARLREGEILSLARQPDLQIVLVDDGSTDGTRGRLERIAGESQGKAAALVLPRNSGKAEAVRLGFREALGLGAPLVGFADADLSTPPPEILRLIEVAEGRPALVIMGSRVRLLGTNIQRNPLRHVLGRVFATVASLAVGLDVYDTQCGAKFFRDTPALRRAMGLPFTSRWAFDVELIERLLSDSDQPYTEADFVEVPLRTWIDVKGSKLAPHSAARAGLDLLRIGLRTRLKRRNPPGADACSPRES